MQFRITSCLVLGLTVSLVGGCSWGERCRLPLLQGFCGGLISNPGFMGNGPTDPGSCPGQYHSPTTGQETWSSADSSGPDSTGQFSEDPAPAESLLQPERPPMELPEAPLPLNRDLEDGDEIPQPPESGRAVPSVDNVESNTSGVSPSAQVMTGAPVVEEQEQVQSVTQDSNNQDNSKNRTKATSISTSKIVPESPVLEEAIPVSDPFSRAPSLETDRETLPAKAFEMTVPAPIVLRAVPTRNHVISDCRIADQRGIGSSGLPTKDAMAFKDLPTLNEKTTSDRPVYSSTSDSPFVESQASDRLPEIDPVRQNQSQPQMELAPDEFTKSAGYHVPTENNASRLLKSTSAVVGGVVIQDEDHPLERNKTRADQTLDRITQRSRLKIASPNPPFAQVQILRMRATTPIDRHEPVSPIVSIKSVADPVIVRNVFPESELPMAGVESAIPRIQAWPSFDDDRLEASIRGLSSRPSVDQARSTTIDR